MLTPAENERLTRIGAGTPMGEALRRYWLPACLSEELPEADGAPVRTRLLGEDLIAYRDSNGNVGLVDAFCPHRRAPLFFGRNEDGGLRCVYHGWKFDRAGTCVDMPSEPPDSLFKTKVTVKAYPAHEAGGIVWTYMGPPQTQPAPPDYEFCRAPETHRYTTKNLQRCNWLQALEGGLDSAHATIMHRDNHGDLTFLAAPETLIPKLEIEATDYGYWYSGIRTLGDKQWTRVYQYVMPATQMRGAIEGPFRRPQDRPRIDGHIWVPIDDENCWVYSFLYAADPKDAISPAEVLEVEAVAGRGPAYINPDYTLKADIFNDYFIDRQRQKTHSFTGIDGINVQDQALQEGMGPICDRSKEHLGTSDRAVIVLRQLLLEACNDVARDVMPRGVRPETYRNVRASDHLIPLDADWKTAIPESVIARF